MTSGQSGNGAKVRRERWWVISGSIFHVGLAHLMTQRVKPRSRAESKTVLWVISSCFNEEKKGSELRSGSRPRVPDRIWTTALTQSQQIQGRPCYPNHQWDLFFFLARSIPPLFDHVELCDWAVIKRIFPTHQQHSPVAQRGPASHPLFSISLVYTPFFWRSCCLTLPVSRNCPSYSSDFRLLVPHQWQPTAKHNGKALCSVSWIPKALWCSAATY